MLNYLGTKKHHSLVSLHKNCPKLLNDTLIKTPLTSNVSTLEMYKKQHTLPYTISTTEQSSFCSGLNSKQSSTLSTSYRRLPLLRNKIYSVLNTLEEKHLTKQHSQSQRHLVNKFLENRRNVSLIQTPFYNNKYQVKKDISENADYRKNLIRDYTGESKFANINQKIDRAKEYYYKQIDLIQKSKSAKQKEMSKILEELESRKVNNLLTNISTIKEKIKNDKHKKKKPIDSIKLEKIAVKSLNKHFNNKIKFKKKLAKSISEEIKYMDAKPYEELFDQHGFPLKK